MDHYGSRPNKHNSAFAGRILTQDMVNVGTSITNRIEHLDYEAYKLLERPEGGVTVIEHYADWGFANGKPRYKEDFDLVTFTHTERGYEYP